MEDGTTPCSEYAQGWGWVDRTATQFALGRDPARAGPDRAQIPKGVRFAAAMIVCPTACSRFAPPRSGRIGRMSRR